ncbi:MAG: methylenetetrahydrofolate reductase [Bacteriovoracia bacterium]
MKPISEILKSGRSFSIEIYPPKTEAGVKTLHERLRSFARYNPDFISVTYGAGGMADRMPERTRSLCSFVQTDTKIPAMAHLTSRNHTMAEIRDILKTLRAAGVKNLMALRGDPPAAGAATTTSPDFQNATDLIALAAKEFDFCIGCAGYPEGHIEAASVEQDWDYLRMKLDLGAHFIASQFFLDNTYFLRFRDQLVRRRIRAPLLAGILPISNYSQVTKFSLMCGCTIPAKVMKGLYGKSDADQEKFGLDHAAHQIEELAREGVDGIHLYALNKDSAVERLAPVVQKHMSRN